MDDMADEVLFHIQKMKDEAENNAESDKKNLEGQS